MIARVWLIAGVILLHGILSAKAQPTPPPTPPLVATMQNTPTALEAAPRTVSGRYNVALFDGPGTTYAQSQWLTAGVEVTVVERNAVGNWVRVIRTQNGSVTQQGWALVGNFAPARDLRLSEIPVNESIADADLSRLQYANLARLYAAPLLSPISQRAQELYLQSLLEGHDPHTVSLIGDSLTIDPLYLPMIANSASELGPYNHLSETIGFFAPSFGIPGVAARIGMASYTVTDPMWADPAVCIGGESPLECEYRLRRPIIALIMFGANDVLHASPEFYEQHMREILDTSIATGVIPVLSTFTYSPESGIWERAVAFNEILVHLADEYQMPLVNVWAGARSLPDYGLEADGAHMTHSGFRRLKLDSGLENYSGVTLRMLLNLSMLDRLRRELYMGSSFG